MAVLGLQSSAAVAGLPAAGGRALGGWAAAALLGTLAVLLGLVLAGRRRREL